jgi:hypothetical protein
MSPDPIVSALLLRIQRGVLFLLVALVVTLGLWGWVLLEWVDLAAGDLWSTTLAAVDADQWHRTTALILRGCGVIGVLATLVLYLLVALWWRRSGDVHRRGTKFIDRRED